MTVLDNNRLYGYYLNNKNVYLFGVVNVCFNLVPIVVFSTLLLRIKCSRDA